MIHVTISFSYLSTFYGNYAVSVFVVNSGDYVQAVCDRNLAENITRVLYPNDNVRTHTC